MADLTAEFVLAHQAGRFRREEVVSHIVNLSRMARPCLPGDPYMVPGKQEPAGSVSAVGDEQHYVPAPLTLVHVPGERAEQAKSFEGVRNRIA